MAVWHGLCTSLMPRGSAKLACVNAEAFITLVIHVVDSSGAYAHRQFTRWAFAMMPWFMGAITDACSQFVDDVD